MPKFVSTLRNAELSSDPTAAEGTFYYNSYTDELKLKGASAWAAIGSSTTVEMPTGSVATWVGSPSTVPIGWLFCDGSAVSRTTYSALFAIVSTYFGAGNGSTTFNLPDFRALSLVGAIGSNAGVAVGNSSKTWTVGTNDPFTSLSHSTDTWAHTHTFTDDTQGAHTHALDHATSTTFSSATTISGHTHTYTATCATNGHSHTVGDLGTSSGTISVNASNDVNAAISHTHTVANVTGGNSHTHTVTEGCSTTGGHTHTYTGSTPSYTGTSGSSGTHSHGGTMAADGTASHVHDSHSANRARVWYVVKS
jgi:microcystin-dependent protein